MLSVMPIVPTQFLPATTAAACVHDWHQLPNNTELNLPASSGRAFDNSTTFENCMLSCFRSGLCAAVRFDYSAVRTGKPTCFFYTPNNDDETDRYMVAIKVWATDPVSRDYNASGSYNVYTDTTDAIGVPLGLTMMLAGMPSNSLGLCRVACDNDARCIMFTVDFGSGVAAGSWQSSQPVSCTLRQGSDLPGLTIRAATVVQLGTLNAGPFRGLALGI
jgi:hypothetical protein